MRRTFPFARRIPCYARSPTGALHYLSSDLIDDLVLDDVLGTWTHLFFPEFSKSVRATLSEGGWILDVGAFNGFWTAEMLVRYPSVRAVLLEPNPRKFRNLLRTLRKSRLTDRTRPVRAALADVEGPGWLIPSAEGSWGNWVQTRNDAPENDGVVPIRVTTLTEALGSARPTVIKCNAEGAEFSLIHAMLDSDFRPDIVILMLHPEFGDLGRARDSLVSMGYSVSDAFADDRRPCWHASR